MRNNEREDTMESSLRTVYLRGRGREIVDEIVRNGTRRLVHYLCIVSVNINSHECCKSESIAFTYVKSVIKMIEINTMNSKCTKRIM